MAKYVYFFGNGKADGKADMKTLLGGKGANLAEMCKIGIPVPPGFTITTEVCAAYYEQGKKIPEAAIPQIDEALKKVEAAFGKKFGDTDRSAAGVRPLRRRPVHARHDEHHPQPRPHRCQRRRPGEEDRQSALRLRQLPPGHRHVRLHGHGRANTKISSTKSTSSRTEKKVKLDTDLTRRRSQGTRQALQGRLQEARRRRFPARPEQAAHARHQRRVQFVERQQGHRISPHRTHHRA